MIALLFGLFVFLFWCNNQEKNISIQKTKEEINKQNIKKEFVNNQLEYQKRMNKNRNNVKMLEVNQIIETKIKKICQNYNNLDEVLEKDKDDFKNLIDLYWFNIENKKVNVIPQLKKLIWQYIAKYCKDKWSYNEMNRMFEQIVKGDLTTMKEKQEAIKKYIQLYVLPDYKKAKDIVNKINKKNEFLQLVFNYQNKKNNPFYLLFHHIYNTHKIKWFDQLVKPENIQMPFIMYLKHLFNQLLNKVGISENEFKQIVLEHYKVKNIKDFKNKIEKYWLQIKHKYKLDKYLPMDWWLTYFEKLKMFKNKEVYNKYFEELFKNQDFVNDMKKFRLMYYYLIYLEPEYYDEEKIKVDFKYWQWLRNFNRMYRYYNEPFNFNVDIKLK